ncbi:MULTISPECIES: transaldolase family protein [Proteiniphilum]|jgi:fructose-6-phosphate aldolase 2|nr:MULTISPECIES: transaldolase family protein [Proteiniphilum]ULB34034.1 fructose-6-phosphate aldolase [Proteiniphilum propionicum]
MIYLADTANINEIKDLFTHFPIEGVTTNPTILAHENEPLSKIIPKIQECIGDKMIHVQTISEKADDILREAKCYKDYFQFDNNYFVKIPVTKEGFRAIQMVKEAGMYVTATAIFTQQQALIAAKAGADFVAPYVNRLDNISSHGIDVVADIVNTFKLYGFSCKVLGASFKNVDQIYRVSMVGCHAVTASYNVLEAILKHPMTDKGVMEFERDGSHLYDVKF